MYSNCVAVRDGADNLDLNLLNLITPIGLLHLPGATETHRAHARQLRLARWARGTLPCPRTPLGDATRLEPSVRAFEGMADLRLAAMAAEYTASSLAETRHGDCDAKSFDQVFAAMCGAFADPMPSWAEATAFELLLPAAPKPLLHDLNDRANEWHWSVRQSYAAAGVPAPHLVTPWHAMDIRQHIFEVIVADDDLGRRPIPLTTSSVEGAIRLRELQSDFPDVPLSRLTEVLQEAVRYAASNFLIRRKNAFTLPGLGFAVDLDARGDVVAAAPGMVSAVYEEDSRGHRLVRLRGPDWRTPVRLLPHELFSEALWKPLAAQGLAVDRRLIESCLKAGLAERLVTLAA